MRTGRSQFIGTQVEPAASSLCFHACVQARRARALTLKREVKVDVVVPATLTMPREHAPDAGSRGTARRAQGRLGKAEIEPVVLAPSSFSLHFDDLDAA